MDRTVGYGGLVKKVRSAVPGGYGGLTSYKDKDKQIERKKVKETSEDAIHLCVLLGGYMRGNNPKARIPESMAAWGKAADLMLTRDKRTLDEVTAVLKFSQSDSFWKCNILSMTKFREKFDQLYLKMEATKNGNAQGGGPRGGRIVGDAKPVPGKYDHLG